MAAGLSLQQTYTVDMIKGGLNIPLTKTNGSPLIAVPSNVGPRTMPDYSGLAAQGIYNLHGSDGASDIRVWAGTAGDPFFIDLGTTFDSLNYRAGAGVEALTPAQDADDQLNSAPDSVAGFNVNTIAIEIPIKLLTSDGAIHAATDPKGSATRMERLLENSVGRFGLYQCLRPLVIGLVHGLAGSAAVALLVLSTIHNPVWATMYLLIFGAGTMLGMMCMTAAIAVPLTLARNSFTKLSKCLGVASGMVSLSFGLLLVYQLGFLGGLFTSHPQWTPR